MTGAATLAVMPNEASRLEMSDDGDTLVLVGEIDSYTAPMLAERLTTGEQVTVVDMSGVSFLDSSGLRVLVEAHQTSSDASTSFGLRAPSASVQHLLEVSGLIGHLDIVD